jgi:hypothetical protein
MFASVAPREVVVRLRRGVAKPQVKPLIRVSDPTGSRLIDRVVMKAPLSANALHLVAVGTELGSEQRIAVLLFPREVPVEDVRAAVPAERIGRPVRSRPSLVRVPPNW